MNTAAQCASAFAVDDTDMENAELLTLAQVIHQQISDFTRLKGVEIQFVRDLYPNWIAFHHEGRTELAISSQSASISFGPWEGLRALENQ